MCSILTPPEDYKIEKQNILNQWFVKLGWFWTTVVILANIQRADNLAEAVSKYISSTMIWYFSTNLFQLLDNAIGFDISGHTFLLIFSNLLISSESRLSDKKLAQPIRVSTLLLTTLWDFMLIQTALYYHTVLQKVIAAVWAIGSWYFLHTLFNESSLSEEKQRERRKATKPL